MMNWIPGFSTPIAAALFGLLVPLIIFYFLKLKRPRLELPSLALWRQVISDQRVNSPFQRFRRNLLMAGALAGSIVIGTTGAVVISSQAAPSTDVVPQITAPVHAWPAGHGPLEGADPMAPISVQEAAPLLLTPSVNPATGKPYDRGFLEDADGAAPAPPADPAPGHGNLEDPG